VHGLAIADAVEAVRVLLREPSRDGLLVRREHVQDEALAAWSAGYMSFCRSTDTRTSGGSSDTDATELAVMPTGRPPGSRVVRTVTPGREATEQLAELSGIDAGHVVTRGIEPGHRL